MAVPDIRQPPPAAAPAAPHFSAAARLAWLHLRGRRAPAALAALLACGAALWASLQKPRQAAPHSGGAPPAEQG